MSHRRKTSYIADGCRVVYVDKGGLKGLNRLLKAQWLEKARRWKPDDCTSRAPNTTLGYSDSDAQGQGEQALRCHEAASGYLSRASDLSILELEGLAGQVCISRASCFSVVALDSDCSIGRFNLCYHDTPGVGPRLTTHMIASLRGIAPDSDSATDNYRNVLVNALVSEGKIRI